MKSSDIKVGDVITYNSLMVNTDDGQVMIYNSHRVIGIKPRMSTGAL
ncbi:MAG: hypothetical protein MZU97_24365 [Bacillus subtilis]|nr:hypothetical protein [Bacillus subtilis]